MSPVTNSFAVDYNAGEHVTDINNPPQKRYIHKEFPKMVYDHESGGVLTVSDDRQLKAALKKGFKETPSPGHDYSKISPQGFAGVAPIGPARVVPPTAEEIALADEEPLVEQGQLGHEEETEEAHETRSRRKK